MPAATLIPKEARRDAVMALYTHEDGQRYELDDGRTKAAHRSVLAAALAKKLQIVGRARSRWIY